MTSADELLNAASQPGIKAIFIDCFDTIISRDVDGQYLKHLWAKRLRIAAGLQSSTAEIFVLRVALEAEACESNSKQHGELEFRYEALTTELYHRLSSKEQLNQRLSGHVFKDICLRVEVALEKQHQTITPLAKCTLNSLAQSAPVYLVSDYYHSSRTLRELVSYHGLTAIFRDIYTSSDFLKTKRSGALYTYLLKQLSLKPSEVFMIGDNGEADYSVPKSLGISVFQSPAASPKLTESLVTKTSLESAISKIAAQRIPFSELSFSLVLFCEALTREASKYQTKRLFFISREGVFLKKLFDSYQSLIFGKSYFKTTYLRASRKATFLPSLGPLQHETFEVLFRQYRDLSLQKFVANLNLSEVLDTELERQFGKAYSMMQKDLPNSSDFKKLLSLEVFRTSYEVERLKQREALTLYLSQLGCTDKDVILVDVGWKGSIQDNLRSVVPDNQRLIGLYLGLSINTSTPNSLKHGLLFDSPTNTKVESCFAKFLPIYEILCAAEEGSTARYAANGTVPSTILSPDPVEEATYRQVISHAQSELFKAFELATKVFNNHHFDNFTTVLPAAAKHHARLLYLPSHEERSFLKKINHLENFGVLEYTKFEHKQTSILTSAYNLAKSIVAPKRTLTTSSSPILTWNDLGLQWLQPAFGTTLIEDAFGNTSGLATNRADLFSYALCRVCRIARRAQILGVFK